MNNIVIPALSSDINVNQRETAVIVSREGQKTNRSLLTIRYQLFYEIIKLSYLTVKLDAPKTFPKQR